VKEARAGNGEKRNRVDREEGCGRSVIEHESTVKIREMKEVGMRG
jgi:hypothetical protein